MVVNLDDYNSSQEIRDTRWEDLHQRVFTTPVQTAYRFYHEWLPRTPSSCCGDVLVYLEASPVEFNSALEFFCSGVDFHNQINLKLGKPVISYETK